MSLFAISNRFLNYVKLYKKQLKKIVILNNKTFSEKMVKNLVSAELKNRCFRRVVSDHLLSFGVTILLKIEINNTKLSLK